MHEAPRPASRSDVLRAHISSMRGDQVAALYEVFDDIERELSDHSWMQDAQPVSLPRTSVVGYVTAAYRIRCARCCKRGDPIFSTECWDQPVCCDSCGALIPLPLSEEGRGYVDLVLGAYGAESEAWSA